MTSDEELTRDWETISKSVGAMWVDRDVISVTGTDAVSYLQGQLSQDVEKIAVGASAWSFVLQPHGKVDALIRVARTETGFVIDTDPGFGALVRERLERFKMRVKVDIEVLDWKVLALRGPQANSVDTGDSVVVNAEWPGIDGVDLLGPNPDVPSGAQVCGDDIYESLRIESGIPQMGKEMDEKTIPAEVGLNDRTISFTKGCYTGQELVARIDSRGNNVPRHLRCVVIQGTVEDMPARGAHIVFAKRGEKPSKPLGVLSSVAFSARLNALVGLALIRRDVVVPVEAIVEGDNRSLSCRLESAPLTT